MRATAPRSPRSCYRRARVPRRRPGARARKPSGILKFGAYAAGAVFVMWLLPVVQQFTHHPGNMQKLVSFSRHAGDRSLGDAVKIVAVGLFARAAVARALRDAQPVLGRDRCEPVGFGLVTLALLVAAVVVCIVRRAVAPPAHAARVPARRGRALRDRRGREDRGPRVLVPVAMVVGPGRRDVADARVAGRDVVAAAGRVLAVVVAVIAVGVRGRELRDR